MIEAHVRRSVRERARHSCEYCAKPQTDSPRLTLHVEHVIPRKHGGTDDIENLALACADCNFRKSSDLAGFDPLTNIMTRLFHPRRDEWSDHFSWEGRRIQGLTDVGRTTVAVLDLNSSQRVQLRIAAGG